MNRRTMVLLFVLSVIAVLVGPGCVGKTRQSYRMDEVIRKPDTGEIVYLKQVRHGAAAEAPDNAAGPTTQSVGEYGGSTTVPGNHDKPLAAYGIEQRQLIFYGGGVAMLIGAIVSLRFGQRMLAGSFFVGMLLLFVMPNIVNAAYVPPIVFAVLLIGGIWAAAVVYRNARENAAGVASAIKLGTQGAAREAVAALRETPLARHVKKGRSP